MDTRILVLNMRTPYKGNGIMINTCSNSNVEWQSDLSPFKLGPIDLYDGFQAMRHENAWQYSKVYKLHTDADGNPTDEYWKWATEGWSNQKAVRYPMGRGAKPEYAIWAGRKLGYVDARKQIYSPLYIKLVTETGAYEELQYMYKRATAEKPLVFRDFDGYDHVKLGMSLTEVLNDPKRKMGHAFLLKMLITNDEALKQIDYE